jgi:hypothetical protein
MSAFFKELLGLFVDDGSLALAILVWCAVAGLALPELPALDPWRAPILFLGCLLILMTNVTLAARRRR